MQSGQRIALEKTTVVGGHGLATELSGNTSRLALTILYHPELERVGERALLDFVEGGSVSVSRAEPLFAHPGHTAYKALLDEHVSRKPIRIFPIGKGGARLEATGSSTALTVRGQLVSDSIYVALRRGAVLELGHHIVLLLHWVTTEDDFCTTGVQEARELVGDSDALRRIIRDIHNVADLELPVLLRGETGSGKELVAHAIHHGSRRRDKPFVAVNLGAISPSLAVAELFGAERGAYTGAVGRRPGFFEQAHGGTLFLDEIGEAPAELQVALLRVLETGEMQTVGASQIRKANVRIIAATDADLEGKVASNSFRAPLLNRLAAYEIWIPPLRDRRDDIGRLLVRFLRETLEEIGESHHLAPSPTGRKLWLPASVAARLADYDWPGNVRQLRNVVRQLVIGNRGREEARTTPMVERLLGPWAPLPATSQVAPLAAAIPIVEPPTPSPAPEKAPARDIGAPVVEGLSREAVQACLDAHNGVIEDAWRPLGLPSRYALARLIRKLGVVVRKTPR